MASSTPSAAVNPRDVLFARGILAGLTIWPALQLAVAENWGGPNGRAKIAWLAGELIDVFVSPAPQQQRDPIVAPGGPAAPGPSPDEEYVEEMLLQVMEDEFDTVLEDGSALVVARRIVGLWSMLASDPQAAEQLVRDLEARADSIKGKRVQAQREEDEDGSTDGSSDEEEAMRMDDEPVPQLFDSQQPRPKQEPVVDEDGFTLVQGKGKGRR